MHTPGAENGGVQGGVQEEQEDEVEMSASNDQRLSSVDEIMDPTGTIVPASESALDPAPGSRQ
jgi:hypothetical protein